MRRKLRQEERLLPSCGVGGSQVLPEAIVRTTCVDVTVDKAIAQVGDTVTAEATLFKRVNTTLVPVDNKYLNYRIMKGTNVVESGSPRTGSNGKITFSWRVDEPGVYQFLASFFGDNPTLPDTPERWIGCRAGLCVGSVGGIPEIPGLIPRAEWEMAPGVGGVVTPPGIAPGISPPGGITGIMTQPPCGLLCGQGLTKKVHGLNSKD